MTTTTNTTPDADETTLDTPLKIRWTGSTRSRIKGHNLDFDSVQSDRLAATLDRQKTNAVIKTVEEAEALACGLNRYIGDGGPEGRTWMNSSADRACQRVQQEVIDKMAERGYARVESPAAYRVTFTPAEEVDEDEDEDGLDAGDRVVVDLPGAPEIEATLVSHDGDTVSVEGDSGRSIACSVDRVEPVEDEDEVEDDGVDRGQGVETDGGTDAAGYDREWVALPPVEEGDVVRVTYRSPQADGPVTRTGEVIEVHVNGFEFDHGKDGYATGVRQHDDALHDGLITDVSTLAAHDNGEGYYHASRLNRGNRSPDAVDVEVNPVETDGGREGERGVTRDDDVAEFTEWEDFLEALRGSLTLDEGTAVSVVYDSSYSDEPQRIQGRVEWYDHGIGRAGHPFAVESSTDDRRRIVRGWNVESGDGRGGGRTIGRVISISVVLSDDGIDRGDGAMTDGGQEQDMTEPTEYPVTTEGVFDLVDDGVEWLVLDTADHGTIRAYVVDVDDHTDGFDEDRTVHVVAEMTDEDCLRLDASYPSVYLDAREGRDEVGVSAALDHYTNDDGVPTDPKEVGLIVRSLRASAADQ